jgi:hypothetical protein
MWILVLFSELQIRLLTLSSVLDAVTRLSTAFSGGEDFLNQNERSPDGHADSTLFQ